MDHAARSLLMAIPLFILACASENEPIASTISHDVVPLSTPACGTVIVTDLRLGSDLSCAGDGLTVGADGIEIDLNGHTIAGSAVGIGITLRGRHNVTIHGGTISGFVTGVFVNTSTRILIKENRMTQNRESVFFAGSSGNTVKENLFADNLLRGVMIRPTGSGVLSTNNLVAENVFTDNPVGVLLFGQPGNTVKENSISGSSTAGIDFVDVSATGNLVKENLLTGNAAAIRIAPTWAGNIFAENRIVQNTCGIQGSTAAHTLSENIFAGNTTDFCN